MYKCPNCGSSSIKKERIYVEEAGREIDTGDKICQQCGFVGTSNEFMDELADENLIKATCKELGLTYKQLGEAIGYSESALNNAARQEKISEPLKRAVELYLENLKLKQELADFKTLKAILAR